MSEQIRINKRKRREVTKEDLQDGFNQERERQASERMKRLLGGAARVVEQIDEEVGDE